MTTNQKICSKCILDTTVPIIKFDEYGVCNYCKIHDALEKRYPIGEDGQKKIEEMIKKIEKRGLGTKYNCIVGVSGGTDSIYCLFLAKKIGLRPLAVHLDNGWDTEIAIHNIKNATESLDVDLKIVKVDWEEFKDLQIAYLKASVSDIEVPTDLGVIAVLYEVAVEEGIPSIINGHSFREEGTAPVGWTYIDQRYVDDVYKKFGKNKKLKNFPRLNIFNLFYYALIRRIDFYEPLEYLDYDKAAARIVLKKELDWKYYGGHHYESIYTRFVTTYILMKKFNIDKRKAYLSGRIRSGKITRGEAIEIIKKDPYPEEKIKEDMEYVLQKLELSNEEFEDIMSYPPKSFLDYSTSYTLIKKLKYFVKVACKLKLIPEIVYEKYAK